MRDFRSLEIWNISKQLAVDIYSETKDFPKAEQYGLTSQIRRAVVSIGANISEGCGRKTNTELLRFISIGLGSLYELEFLLILSNEIDYIKKESLEAYLKRIEILKIKMSSFMKKLKEISE